VGGGTHGKGRVATRETVAKRRRKGTNSKKKGTNKSRGGKNEGRVKQEKNGSVALGSRAKFFVWAGGGATIKKAQKEQGKLQGKKISALQ